MVKEVCFLDTKLIKTSDMLKMEQEGYSAIIQGNMVLAWRGV